MKSLLKIENIKNKNDYTVFDAKKNNKGKGIKATDLIKILKKHNLSLHSPNDSKAVKLFL